MILLTGASGQVGMHLLKAFSERGIEARAFIHSNRSEEAVLQAGAKEVYIGDMSSKEDVAAAMAGVDAVYYICNTANPKEDEIGFQLIDAAKKAGNITFIYHSVMHSLLTDMQHHKRKLAVEKALVDSGIPYMILQPAVFMQMFAPAINSVKAGGPFIQKFYTSEKTRMSYVDMSDYAEVAAEMISAGTYLYGTYELCSEGTYSLADMESILSDLTGREVREAFISDEKFLETAHRTPDSYEGKTLLAMFKHYNTSSFCGNAFTLTQILGRKPVTIRDFLKNGLQDN